MQPAGIHIAEAQSRAEEGRGIDLGMETQDEYPPPPRPVGRAVLTAGRERGVGVGVFTNAQAQGS